VPPGVLANTTVTLIRPALKCFIVPGSHNPGSAAGLFTSGAGFKAMQRK